MQQEADHHNSKERVPKLKPLSKPKRGTAREANPSNSHSNIQNLEKPSLLIMKEKIAGLSAKRRGGAQGGRQDKKMNLRIIPSEEKEKREEKTPRFEED
jgi:hypothetical protein